MRVTLNFSAVVLSMLVALGAGASAASAGTYTVSICEGNAASIFTQTSAGGGMGTTEDCANGGLGLELTAVGHQSGVDGEVVDHHTRPSDKDRRGRHGRSGGLRSP